MLLSIAIFLYQSKHPESNYEYVDVIKVLKVAFQEQCICNTIKYFTCLQNFTCTQSVTRFVGPGFARLKFAKQGDVHSFKYFTFEHKRVPIQYTLKFTLLDYVFTNLAVVPWVILSRLDIPSPPLLTRLHDRSSWQAFCTWQLDRTLTSISTT